MSENDGIVSRRLVRTINQVAENNNIKAVVLRVNSPGGSAYGSEQIWHALTELREKKPLIVSMGDVAASGGYYIAVAGNKIVAQPNTLTGSIGVFGQIPNFAGLANRIGLNFDVVKTNRMGEGVITGYRAFTPDERAIMQHFVNQTYDLFLQRIAEGRGMTIEQVKSVAEGRVWTGESALELELIDELGGLDRAIALAAEAAELENFGIVKYPEKEDFMTILLRGMSGDLETRFLRSRLGTRNYEMLKHIGNLENMNGVFALMPFGVEVN
jgi:protease-4